MGERNPTEPDAQARGYLYPWLVVAMLWCISFFNYADRQAMASVLPLLELEMPLDKVDKGMIISAFAWVYGLMSPLAGWVVDRVRRKSAILGGLHVWSIICIATALSRRLWHLIAFRAAEGLGETFYYPAATSMVSDYHRPGTRSRALGLHQTSVYAGTIAGGFFAGLIGQHYGWRASFIVFGGLGILLGFVLHRFLREPARGAADEANVPPQSSPFAALQIVWRTPAVMTLMVAFSGANFVALVLLGWMPSYLYEKFGMDLAVSGLTATGPPQIASLLGAIAGGFLADALRQRFRGGRVVVQALGVFGGAPFVFWCGQTREVSALIVALTAWGFFKGLYDANIFASAFDVVPPEHRGSVAGLMNMVGWLFGGAAAPVVIGFLAERQGLGWAISSAAGAYVATGLVLLISARQVRGSLPLPLPEAGRGDHLRLNASRSQS